MQINANTIPLKEKNKENIVTSHLIILSEIDSWVIFLCFFPKREQKCGDGDSTAQKIIDANQGFRACIRKRKDTNQGEHDTGERKDHNCDGK
ncbi:MAG: hypothetical protein HKP58_14775 [Desulfatitalea sp.]|nr:hypothetical protein [Desulfatitalea sp.]NNK01671.1 hypothetical protein [Desulfatitalea sp.]